MKSTYYWGKDRLDATKQIDAEVILDSDQCDGEMRATLDWLAKSGLLVGGQ